MFNPEFDAVMNALERMRPFQPQYVHTLLNPAENRDELLRYIAENTKNAEMVNLFLVNKYPSKDGQQTELFRIVLNRNLPAFDMLLSRKKNLPVEFCAELAGRQGKKNDYDFDLNLLKQKFVSPQVILDLYNYASHHMTAAQFKSVIIAVLVNPNTPDVVVEHVARNPAVKSYRILGNVLSRPNLPPKALEELLKMVREAKYFSYFSSFVKQENITSQMLYEVSKVAAGKDVKLLVDICEHPLAPAQLLKNLVIYKKNPPTTVALAIARNPNAPSFIVEELATNSLNKLVVEEALKNLHENSPEYQQWPFEWVVANFSKQ